MEIELLSRDEVKTMIKHGDDRIKTCHWISISDDYDESPLPDNRNILKVYFDDAVTQDHPDMDLFDNNDAKRIITFVQHLPPTPLYVHCYAGVSRSGAVGKVLNIYLNLMLRPNPADFKRFIAKYDNAIQPNRRVEQLLWLEICDKVN